MFMQRTQRKDAVRNIFKRKISYLSILLTITLGVTGLLCIFFLGISMEKVATAYYAGSHFRDIEITASLGLSEEDLNAVRGLEQIADAEGIYSAEAFLSNGSVTKKATLWSATERINTAMVQSGRMPESDSECAIDIPLAEKLGVSVGDTVRIYLSGSPEGFLRRDVFTVTGTVRHPQSVKVDTAANVVVAASAFDPEKTEDGYTGVLAMLDIPREKGMFSDRYVSDADDAVAALKPALAEITARRTASIRAKYDGEYADARAEADEKLSDAKAQLDDAEAEMNDAFETTEAELSDKEAQLADGEERLEAELSAQYAQIEAAERMGMNMAAQRAELDAAADAQRAELEKARGELDAARREFEDEKTKALSELAEKRREYAEKEEEARRELDDAKRKLDDIPDGTFIVLDRPMNEGYEEMRSTLTAINTMGIFFSPLFALVAAVVFFSTIAIIIEEQKKQVGTVKALGFRNRKIRAKYLLFGVTAAVVGSVLGIILSVRLEDLMLNSVEASYTFGNIPALMNPLVALVFCSAVIVLVLIVVGFACSHLLRCSAVGLINGSEPAQKSVSGGKGDKPRKGSLYSALILNNIRTDTARVIVGITVIAASSLLIGAGITLRQSFADAFRLQRERIGRYDLQIMFDESAPADALREIEDVISASGAAYAPAYSGGTVYEAADGGFGTTLLVMDADRVGEFFSIGAPAASGVTLSKNIAAAHALNAGAQLALYGRSLERETTAVADTFDYYVGNMIAVTKQAYREMFGSECADNCYFVKYNGADGEALRSALTALDRSYAGHVCPEPIGEQLTKAEALERLFNLIAVIFISIATALVFLIMTNLSNILVNRRMKELLIMRVNGFSMKQVVGYLVRETAFTTVCGIVLGVAAGIPFSGQLVRSLSTPATALSDAVVPAAWVISAALSILFAVIINAIAFRKVGKTRLTKITEY